MDNIEQLDQRRTTTDDMKAKLSDTGETVKNKAAVLTDRAKEVISDPKQRQAKQADAEDWIRRNPLRATGLAFAAGYRLGRMLPKR